MGEDPGLHAVQPEFVESDLQGLPDGGGRPAAASRLAGNPVAEPAELPGPADHAGQGETTEEAAGVIGDDEGVGAVRGSVTLGLLEGLALPASVNHAAGRSGSHGARCVRCADEPSEGGGVAGVGGAQAHVQGASASDRAPPESQPRLQITRCAHSTNAAFQDHACVGEPTQVLKGERWQKVSTLMPQRSRVKAL